MSNIIKSSISATSDMYDLNGQWLPQGNYYYTLTSIRNGAVKGLLSDRTADIEYIFAPKNVIRMMSVAQARLARRANISDTHMPTVSSPSESHDYPRHFVFPPIHRQRRNSQNSNRANSPTEVCTICLELVRSNERKLPCNHVFHENCINRWLSRRQHCPVCRRSTSNRRNRQRSVRTSHPRTVRRRQQYNRIYRESLPRLIG